VLFEHNILNILCQYRIKIHYL